MVRQLIAVGLVIAMGIAIGCNGGEHPQDVTMQPEATTTAAKTTEATASPTTIARASETVVPSEIGVVAGMTLLRAASPVAEASRHVVFPEPPLGTAVRPPAGEVSIFDRESGKSRSFGAGWMGSFSPDGGRAAWMSDQGIHVFDFETLSKRVFEMDGLLIGFVDDGRLLLTGRGGSKLILDIESGRTTERSVSSLRVIPLEQAGATKLYVLSPWPSSGVRDYELVLEGRTLTIRGALAVALLDESRVVIGMPTTDDVDRANLFLIDLSRSMGELIATVRLNDADGSTRAALLPLAAAGSVVAWTTGYCGSKAEVSYLDLGSGEVTETNLGGWVDVLPDGRLTQGDGYGASSIVNPETAEWEFVMVDENYGGIAWDSSYRRVMTGPTGGHGTGCPGV